MATNPQMPPSEGLLSAVQRLGHSLTRVLVTRLEILSTEVAEERYNLTMLALGGLIVLFCLQLGLIFTALFAVLAVAAEHRLAAIGIAAVVMLLGAFAGGSWLRWWLKTRPPLFAATIAELYKDLGHSRHER
ncbi:MAG TPA: phage holin family protein [Thermoanaerobaculaceae bacterium]|nr:phage holin family protein [Thermoanaerobaculaceae bacterium]